MNIANIFTFSRIPIMILGGLCLSFCPEQKYFASIAFVLFAFGSFTDFLDGYFARKLNQVSDFGKFMDAITDKIMVLGFIVAMGLFGVFSGYEILLFISVCIIITREFIISGLRMIASVNGTVIAAQASGKLKTFTQMTSMSVLLLSWALKCDFGVDCKILTNLGLIVFAISTLLTLTSGLSYLQMYKKSSFK